VEALRLRHPAPYLAAGGETAAEFRHGVNFAVGGSTALPPEFYEGRGLKPFVPVSLANQTAWFYKVLQILGSSDHGKKIKKKTLEIINVDRDVPSTGRNVRSVYHRVLFYFSLTSLINARAGKMRVGSLLIGRRKIMASSLFIVGEIGVNDYLVSLVGNLTVGEVETSVVPHIVAAIRSTVNVRKFNWYDRCVV
jgi:hypothetical protein